MRRLRIPLLLMAVALCAGAQTPAAAPATETADVRATPRSSVFGFLQACREGDYRSAASFLDVRGRRGADGASLARMLKDILDRKLTTDPGKLSNSPEGDLTDGLDAKFEFLGTAKVGGRNVDLLLERVSREDNSQVWLISSGAVNMIPVLHKELANTWFEDRLPSWMLARGWFDTAIWQWLGLLLLTLVAYVLGIVLAQIVSCALRPVFRRTPSEIDDRLIASVAGPARLLFAVTVYRVGEVWLNPSALLRTYLARLLTALLYAALAWLAMRIVDVIATKIVATMTARHRTSASSVAPLIRRTIKASAVVIAVLATLNAWGYNTTALLAGLGVGGLAVALAAQKTIENLFGGVAITTDKPVLVGDFCRYGDRLGTVEDIGLRSTRVRTTDRTLVTIPNGQFSSLAIENFGRRDKILFNPKIRLRLDTTPEQLRALIPAIRELLLKQPKIDPSVARVRFIAISDYSVDLEIFTYVVTTDFDEFLIVQEQLLLGILDEVHRAGTGLAVPARRNLVSRDRVRELDRALT